MLEVFGWRDPVLADFRFLIARKFRPSFGCAGYEKNRNGGAGGEGELRHGVKSNGSSGNLQMALRIITKNTDRQMKHLGGDHLPILTRGEFCRRAAQGGECVALTNGDCPKIGPDAIT